MRGLFCYLFLTECGGGGLEHVRHGQVKHVQQRREKFFVRTEESLRRDVLVAQIRH